MFVKEKAAGEVKALSAAAKGFLKAAKEMEKRGLCKFYLCVDDGRICTAQAIALGFGGGIGHFTPEGSKAMGTFRRVVGIDVCPWNNEVDRTTADSVAMLRHVAAKV